MRLYHLLMYAILKIQYTYFHSGTNACVKKPHARSWVPGLDKLLKAGQYRNVQTKNSDEGNHPHWPLTAGWFTSTCTCPSYPGGYQAPEFLVWRMSRVTSVPESGCQPPTQLRRELEAQWSITKFLKGLCKDFVSLKLQFQLLPFKTDLKDAFASRALFWKWGTRGCS